MTSLIYSRHFGRVELGLVCACMAVFAACVLAATLRLGGIDDPVMRFATAFIGVQIVAQSLLIAGVAVSKHVRMADEAAQTARKRKMEEFLARPDTGMEVLRMAQLWPDDFLAVVGNAMQTLAGSARRHVIEALEVSDPYRQLLCDLTDARPNRVIRAISVLGKIDNDEARSAVQRGLQHPAEAVRRAARKAIVTGGDESARRQVLEDMVRLPFWERIILFQLVSIDSTVQAFLSEALASGDDQKCLLALEFVLTRQRLLLFAVPGRLARSSNFEVRIKFFRALPFLDVDEDVQAVLERGLHDEDWRVRAMAARACGSLRVRPLAWRLLEMCSTFGDPAEAGHAARALASLGGEGWSRLQEVVASGTGQGRRIAAEVVDRRTAGVGEASV